MNKDIAKALWVDPTDSTASTQIANRISSLVIAANTDFNDPVQSALANFLSDPANFTTVNKEEKQFEPGYKKTNIYAEWVSWEIPVNETGEPKGKKFMMYDFKNYRTQYWMFIPKF